jgi:hypothetical protein
VCHTLEDVAHILQKPWFTPRFIFFAYSSFAIQKINSMSTHQTHQLLNNLQQQTDQFINKAVSDWQMLLHKQFAYKVAPEQWSANQCLRHLNSYGQYYLPAMGKAIAIAKQKSVQHNSIFKSSWLGNYFTNLMQPKADGALPKKMQSPKNHQPQNNAESHLVIAEFIEQQEQLLLLMEQARQLNLNTIKVPISIAPFIKLKLGDVFMFLVAHNKRHVLQAERAIQNILKVAT